MAEVFLFKVLLFILRITVIQKNVCNPILIIMFPEWLSSMEPWSRTPSAVHLSSLCLYCVCVLMYCFAGFIRRRPPTTFSDIAITDPHSDTTIFQLRAHWVWIFWSIGSAKSFGHVPPVGVKPSTSCLNGEYPIHKALELFRQDSGRNIGHCHYVLWQEQAAIMF